MKILTLVVCFFLLFSFPVHSQVVELLDFNPEYEEIDFSVEGTIKMHVFLINPTLNFYGTAGENEKFSDPLVPAISVTEASLSVLSLPIIRGRAESLAKNITEMATGVSRSTDVLLRNYRTVVLGEDLYFVFRQIIGPMLTNAEIVNLIENGEITDLALEKGFDYGIVYGGKMTFNDGLVRKITVYSDDWWANLELEWETIQEKYFFPEKITGEGYYSRPISIEFIFSDYKIE